MSESLLEIGTAVTGKRAPSVSKTQELSAKTNKWSFSWCYDVVRIWSHNTRKKHKNNIFKIIFTTEYSVSLYIGQVLVYILRVVLDYFTRCHETRWGDGLWVAEICRHHSYSTQAPTVVNHRHAALAMHWFTNHQVVIPTGNEERVGWSNQKRRDDGSRIEAKETTATTASHVYLSNTPEYREQICIWKNG